MSYREIQVVMMFAQVSIPELANWAQQHWITLAVAGGLLVVAWWLLRMAFSRRRIRRMPQQDLTVDISVLPDAPPPPGPPVLEFYHLPVRLVAVVLAPVGRAHELPSQEDMPETIDSIVPGLDAVVTAHQPLIRTWPRQLSSRGFAHAFFQQLRFPGQHGKKTVWSSVAGIFRVDDEPMMAGLVLRAETANRHGNYVMENENQWLGILRVRLN